MTKAERAELRAAAEAIVEGLGGEWRPYLEADRSEDTPGWHVVQHGADRDGEPLGPVPIAHIDPHGYMGTVGTTQESIARFLALLHPRRVLAILDRLDRLRALEEFAAEVKATIGGDDVSKRA